MCLGVLPRGKLVSLSMLQGKKLRVSVCTSPRLFVSVLWDQVCAGMRVCVRVNLCKRMRPPSSQLPGQRSVGGH